MLVAGGCGWKDEGMFRQILGEALLEDEGMEFQVRVPTQD